MRELPRLLRGIKRSRALEAAGHETTKARTSMTSMTMAVGVATAVSMATVTHVTMGVAL